MSTIAETLQVALAHHQAGRRQLAEQLYRQVLAADPGHAGALHLLGLLVLQSGRPALAVDYISAAIRLSGNQAVFHANLGEALRALGRWDDARRSYEQAIAIEPNLAAAHNNLGTILQVQGQLAASIGSYRRALAIQPAYADAHNNLGTALQAAGVAVGDSTLSSVLRLAVAQGFLMLTGRGRYTRYTLITWKSRRSRELEKQDPATVPEPPTFEDL